jgi:hypothetical protein
MKIIKLTGKAALCAALLLPASSLFADDSSSSASDEAAWKLFDHGHSYGDADAPSFGGILFPHLHAFGSFGDSTADPANLAVGHHDPQRDVTLQGFEPGMSLRAGMLQGFVTGAATTDADGDFDFEIEEGFLKLVELPFGLELRGGQFFNRFGYQSALHSHGWDFVNQNLVNGRLLSEGELITRGGELSWAVPIPAMTASILSVSVGDARVEDHDHAEGEHGHGEEAEFEAEGAFFGDLLTGINWINQYDIDDRHRLSGTVSSAFGENRFGRDTAIYGVGFEYLWRDRGYSAGGRSLRWRSEVVYRTVDATSGHLPGEEEEEEHHDDEHGEEHHDEHEDDEHHDDDGRFASFDDIGAYSSLVYGFNEHVEVGLRGDWVSGNDSFGLDDRWRISPAVTFYANAERNFQARLQYDYDYSDDFGSENSVWLQIGFNWGGGEVR